MKAFEQIKPTGWFLPRSSVVMRQGFESLGEGLSSALKELKRCRLSMASIDAKCQNAANLVNAGADRVCSALQDTEQSRIVDGIAFRREMFARLNALEDKLEASQTALEKHFDAELAVVVGQFAAKFDTLSNEIGAKLDAFAEGFYAGIGAMAESLNAQLATESAGIVRTVQGQGKSAAEAARDAGKMLDAELRNAVSDAEARILDSEARILDSVAKLGDATSETRTAVAAAAEAARDARNTLDAELRDAVSGAEARILDSVAKLGDATSETRTAVAAAAAAAGDIGARIGDVASAQKAAFDSAIGDAKGEILDCVVDKAGAVVKTINDGRGLYYNPDEIVAAEARGLCDIAKRPGFEEEYRALVRNLPPESVATINRIISRLERIKGRSGRLEIYTDDEKVKLRELLVFWKEVVSVSDGMYCWRNYMLPKNHFSPNVFFYRYGMDLMKNPEAFRTKDVIDAGAYIGDSALILSEYTSGRIFCFEASSRNHALMQKTLAMNGLDRAVAENLALGSHRGEMVLRECEDRSDRNSFRTAMLPNPDSVETCRVITLDEYVEEKKLTGIGLIKMDVEGTEQDVIKGALNTIRKFRPALLISIYHNADDFMKIKPMIEALDLDYDMRIYHPSIRSVVDETLLVCEQRSPAAKPPSRTRRPGIKKTATTDNKKEQK